MLKKVVLHKFKRFFLTGVEHYEYTPSSNITIIAWHNGYGKSSMLSQLTPMPADLKKDYKEGGYKYLEYEMNGSTYIVSSGYLGPNKHSFIKDGKELNENGSAKTQKTLVEDHFKINNSIFSILLGTEVLTTMSPMIRKQWFTLLSPIDYTFPIKVWSNLRSRARDILGSIKILQEDLINKSNNVIKPEEIEPLKKKSEELNDVITKLSTSLKAVTQPSSRFEDKSVITDVFNKYYRNRNTILEIEESLGKLTKDKAVYDLGNYENEYKKLNNELELKAKEIKTLEHLKSEDELNNLKNKQKELETKIANSSFKNVITPFAILEEELNNVISVSKVHLDSLLSPSYSNIGGKKELLELRTKIDKLKSIFNSKKGIITTLNNSISELKNSKSLELSCPNCNHSFHYEPRQQLVSLENKLKIETEELTKIEKVLKEHLYLEYMTNNKIETLELFINILHKYNDLKPFLGNVSELPIETIPSVLNKARVLLLSYKEYEKDKQTYEEISKDILIIIRSNELASKLGISSIKTLEDHIQTLTDTRSKLIVKINKLKNYLNLVNEIDNLVLQVKKYQKFRKSEYSFKIDSKYNALLLDNINSLKYELSTLQKKIQENDINASIIKNLQTTIEINKEKLSVVSSMVKVLSPDGGLIAKSINSFLNSYLGEMNNIINSVWKYPMVILPCEVSEENDLDYKFRVKVNNDEIIEDVSKLSSSMQEIVNLAFKLVFIKYLDLDYFPILLDEFGKTMDAEHRIAAFSVIDKVLSANFSQIILVCHFESMYSGFANCDMPQLEESKNTLKDKDE